MTQPHIQVPISSFLTNSKRDFSEIAYKLHVADCAYLMRFDMVPNEDIEFVVQQNLKSVKRLSIAGYVVGGFFVLIGLPLSLFVIGIPILIFGVGMIFLSRWLVRKCERSIEDGSIYKHIAVAGGAIRRA